MKAYIHAVAAKCGFSVTAEWSQDHGCVDHTIGAASPVGAGNLTRPKIDLQLKATTQAKLDHGEYISWKLKISHYNYMRGTSASPMLLCLLMLPDNAEDSIEHTLEYLQIRRCAYWLNMATQPPVVGDQSSKTVRVPKNNVFSPAGLISILEKVSKGEQP